MEMCHPRDLGRVHGVLVSAGLSLGSMLVEALDLQTVANEHLSSVQNQ